MRLRPKAVMGAGWAPTAWLLVAGLAWWSGRPTPLPAAPAAPRSVLVHVPAGSPAARDWAHFFACSGLAGDAGLMHATLLLNDGGDEALWRRGAAADTPVRLALAALPGQLSPGAERILSDAPRVVADCGATP